MQKLRPYVLPGLFVFHLVVLCAIVFTVSPLSNTSQQTTLEIRCGQRSGAQEENP